MAENMGGMAKNKTSYSFRHGVVFSIFRDLSGLLGLVAMGRPAARMGVWLACGCYALADHGWPWNGGLWD